MEELKKIALFGGSFDPVTNAHRDIIQKLSERFDRVIVMPTAISPFKTGAPASASGEQRAEMIGRATRGIDNVTVSRYELKREGVSYSVNTIEHLIKKYSAQVYTVIGSEELPYLDKWKERDKLKEITTFYVIERSGFPLTDEVIKARSKGWKVRTAPFTVGSESSSEVKLARAFGRDCRTVPKNVAKYIVKNGLYNDYRYITDRYEEFGLKSSRIAHIERVAYCAVNLAKKAGVSAHDAIVASLLHDIAKETDKEWFVRNGMKVPDTSGMPKPIRHAVYGAVIARECFGVDNEEILDAIRLHTTGGVGMSKLSEVVFLADYIEEGREFDGVEEIRLAARESLEKGVKAALARTIEHIEEDGGTLYGATEEAYEYYKSGKKKSSKTEKASAEKNAGHEKAKSKKSEQSTAPEPEKAEAAPAPEIEKPSEKSDEAHEKAHALAREIGGYMLEKKGREVTLIDVSERTVVTDYFVIATAGSTTQVRALADYVDEKLSKGKGLEPLHRDNNPQWYVVDYGNVIVHIFVKSTREVYSLERLWSDGTNEEILGD